MSDQLSSDLAALRIDRGASPRRGGGFRVVVWVLILLGLAAAAYVLGVPYLENKVFKREVQVTEILVVSPAQGTTELTATGYVMPQVTANIAAKVPGKVLHMHVRQGSVVKLGDPLFELEQNDQNAAIATAQSRVASARAEVQTAKASMLEAKLQAARTEELSRSGAVSKSSSEDLNARVASLEAALKAAEARTVAAQKEVEALKVNAESYAVRAPISGTIVNKPPEVGELVGPAMAGVVSQLGGIEIADFASFAVESDVPEQRLARVAVSGPCEITLDAFPERRFRGKVKEINPRVNRAKATVVVKVAFIDEASGVLPDMSARVSFLAKELDARALQEKPKLVVPSAAIATRAGGKQVFVLDGDKVRMTPIIIGEPLGDGFVLKNGPAAGTRVIKEPPADLADGQAVKPKGE